MNVLLFILIVQNLQFFMPKVIMLLMLVAAAAEV
jgi:hypothetical protein